MQDLHRLAEHVAAGSISVLILGETGAGKEVLAERVHHLSPRRDKPLLRLSCAALAETLLESALFGHERGSFTGATEARPGLLETAHGGTVLLDEVGELSMSTQVKLLRVLEERQVLRVGAVRHRPIDVRFLAATNRDLEAEVERGAFRRDLYFRLSGATLAIPPLRERVGEIAGLARLFLAETCLEMGRDDVPELAPDALALLEAYGWPGNIRELRNVIQRAVLLCRAGAIRPQHLPAERMRARPPAAPAAPAPAPEPQPHPLLRDEVRRQIEALERERIIEALARAGGNQSAAAQLLGMPRRTLVKRLVAYAIPRPRKRSE
jgi:transcriptional regulator with GAF, ATPase, and Fis domain